MTGQAAAAPAKRPPTAGKASAKRAPRRAPRIRWRRPWPHSPSSARGRSSASSSRWSPSASCSTSLYLVRSVIGLLLIAVFLAVALGPAVDRASSMKLPRPAAILAVFLGLFLAIFLIGLVVVPPIVNEVQAFADDVPSYIDDIRTNDTLREYDDKYDITKKLEDQASSLPSRLGDAAGALQAVTVGVFSTVIQLVTVLTITFFLLLDGGRIANFLLAQVRREHQERVRERGRGHLQRDRRLRRRRDGARDRGRDLDLHPAQRARRAVRRPAGGADGVLRPDPARRLDHRRRARRAGDAVRRLPRGHARSGWRSSSSTSSSRTACCSRWSTAARSTCTRSR